MRTLNEQRAVVSQVKLLDIFLRITAADIAAPIRTRVSFLGFLRGYVSAMECRARRRARIEASPH